MRHSQWPALRVRVSSTNVESGLIRTIKLERNARSRRQYVACTGPRSPTPGAPYAYVTTPGFLARFGFESLRDLPDIEKLEDAGLLGMGGDVAPSADALADELRGVLGLPNDEDEPEEEAA